METANPVPLLDSWHWETGEPAAPYNNQLIKKKFPKEFDTHFFPFSMHCYISDYSVARTLP